MHGSEVHFNTQAVAGGPRSIQIALPLLSNQRLEEPPAKANAWRCRVCFAVSRITPIEDQLVTMRINDFDGPIESNLVGPARDTEGTILDRIGRQLMHDQPQIKAQFGWQQDVEAIVANALMVMLEGFFEQGAQAR